MNSILNPLLATIFGSLKSDRLRPKTTIGADPASWTQDDRYRKTEA
ncbi:MAG: hypothetical protein ACI9XK_004141 [Granulosicoccus sp.]|jgi:hypothetical protein